MCCVLDIAELARGACGNFETFLPWRVIRTPISLFKVHCADHWSIALETFNCSFVGKLMERRGV